MSISPERTADLTGLFPDQHVLVVGDMMLDRYVYGEVERISPEAPVPVVRVRREEIMPGGSSNVAWNVQALSGRASVCGVIGSDVAGDDLVALLAGRDVGTGYLLRDPDHPTTLKTRVVAERQQVVRVDREGPGRLDDALLQLLCETAVEAVKSASAVILEDYGKGVIVQEVIDAVLSAAEAHGIPAGFDPKENHALRVDGVTIATPNRREAFLASGVPELPAEEDPMQDKALCEAARRLYERWAPRHLLITLGPHGMMLVTDGEPAFHIPTRAREVFDVSGAGDTVIATCVLALASGASAEEAADLANYAAGAVVGKLGTATCTPKELLAQVG